MNVINLSVPAGVSSPVAECGTVMIGYVGEGGVTQVALDFSTWREAYGDGVVTLGVQRSGDPAWYPVVLDVDGTSAVWLVSKTDTNVEGVGVARFAYTVGGAEKRSAVWQFFVDRGLQSPEGDAPDPYESWVETLTELGAETLQNAQGAQEAAEDAETAKNAAEAAQEAAEAAKRGAEEAAESVGESEEAAAESARLAKLSEDNAKESENNAAQSEQNVAESARQAKASADAADDARQDAQEAVTTATGAAAAAAQSATDAEAAEHRTETKAADAIQQINTAGATQVQSVNTTGATQVQAVEDKGQEVLDSIPPDYSAIVSDVEAIEDELDGVATEATAQQTLTAEDDGAFWLGRVLMVMDGLADDLIAMVEAEIAKLPQDENGQAIAASIGEGNSWLNMLYHELEVS